MEETKATLNKQSSELNKDPNSEQLSLIRLSRSSAFERFSPVLRETIKAWLLNGWADVPTPVLLPKLPDGDLELDKTIVMKKVEVDPREDTQTSSQVNARSKEVLSHQKIQLRLRKLVSQEASWPQIKSLCDQWIELEANAQTAAKIMELASLHANQEDWLKTIRDLLNQFPNAYSMILPDLRESMILLLWQLDERDLVSDAVLNRKGDQQLVDDLSVEKISLLLHLIVQDQKEEALLYFKNNEAICLAALRKFSNYFHMTENQLKMCLARFAAEKNLPHEMRRLGGTKNESVEDLGFDDEYIYQESHNDRDHSYKVDAILQKVILKKNWQDRLDYIKKIANLLQRVDPNKMDSSYLSVLARITQEPMSFVPDLPQTLSDYTKFLWEYRALSVLIPKWFHLLDQFAPVWCDEQMENAIWGFAAESEMVLGTNQENYWFALASLHLSAVNLKTNPENSLWEKRLWEARDLYLVTIHSKNIPVKYFWDDLLESLQENVLQSYDLDLSKRDKLVFHLEMFKESPSKTQLDLEKNEIFLGKIKQVRTWEFLKNFYRSNHSYKNLEVLLQNYFRLFSISNFDLALLWETSVAHFDYDRSWRIASILSSRESLHKSVEVSWQVSGERRSFYDMNPISDQDVMKLWSSYSKKELRFFHALFKLAPCLAEIFKIVGAAESTQSMDTISTLKSLSIFSARANEDASSYAVCPIISGNKVFETTRAVGKLSTSALPSWIEVYPSNPWTELLFRIAQRNGFFIWEWKLSQLRAILSDVVIGISRKANAANYSTRVAQWLRGLDAEQRSSWSELPVLCKNYKDEVAFKNLFLFLAKVTTLIYPAHFQALESMRVMRVQLEIIREYESWLLSTEYADFRNQLGQKTLIPTPKHFERAEKILK